jgi:hypothetical protein
VRTTSPTLPDALGNPRPTGEVTIFWKERGALAVAWPKYYNSYIIQWPDTAKAVAYSTYVRVESNADEGDTPASTAVKLNPLNNPSLLFQDDPTGVQSQLANGNEFYTSLTLTDPEGRALIKHLNGEGIWYERVHSVLDINQPGYSAEITADVGARISPPAGHESLVGYIRQKTGTAFNPGAYIDPFIAGFEAAKRGAIIPVNARDAATVEDKLEVWWYIKSTPPAGSNLQPNYWPTTAQVYDLKWPDSPDQIIMASNRGSGDLPSVQASGRIYYQNDSTKPGFNPNDEHALLLGGAAWALRDDLATPETSPPYVLLNYTAGDGLPAMRVFEVRREDLDASPPISFVYPAVAGKVLQGPMPLPLLTPTKFAGTDVYANYEEGQSKSPQPANAKASPEYSKFTKVDRKGNTWVYRGPHTDGDVSSFEMKYFYPAQDGFFVPGVPLANQPKSGDPMPYLRNTPPAGTTPEAYAKAANNRGHQKQALGITFVPQWPQYAPVMRMGETLTLPKHGLPAVRGQTSVQVLYEQALAQEDEGSSVTLFDPTVAKVSGMEEAGLTSNGNFKLPVSVNTNLYQGKYYFPNLPPHLVERFYLDPNVGAKGSVLLIGKFFDEAFGDDYLHLNVLSAKDITDLEGLCIPTDEDFAKWKKLIADLSVTMTRYVKSTKKPGTFEPATPNEALQSKIDKIWAYIDSRNWRHENMPPTAAEIASGSGVPNTDNQLDTAVDWIERHFADLNAWDTKKHEVQPTKERDTLTSRFESHMAAYLATPTTPRSASSRAGYTYSSRSSAAANEWANYETRKKEVESIRNWIFEQDSADPLTKAAPSKRRWDSTGLTIAKTDLFAADLRRSTQTQSGTSDFASSSFVYNIGDGSNAPVATDALNIAWVFIASYRGLLEEWDSKISAPTPAFVDGAKLQDGFAQTEQNASEAVDNVSIAQVTHQDVAVDSYALTVDGGEGWVTIIVGDGEVFTPDDEPISMYVMRVGKPLSPGELKVVQPSNPLSEKLTLQSSLDFAGKPEQYEFQWKTLPPVDGQPPQVYSFGRQSVLSDGLWTLTHADGTTENLNLPANVQLIENPSNDPPVVISPVIAAQRTFHLDALPNRLFVSAAMDATDGMVIIVNGNEVARRNTPGASDSAVVTPPLPSFQPLRYVYEVPLANLKTGPGTEGDNTLTLELRTDAPRGTSTLINARVEALVTSDLTSTWLSVSALAHETADVSNTPAIVGKNRHTIEGNSLFTLTDNYFIYRYRAIDPAHDAYETVTNGGGWSNWTEPQLAEGWIKRALAGINPFEQRVKDLYNNDVNTDVSLVTQAGKRWEGDVALNLANIDNFGLIEIYETILRRGKGLSIEGVPALSYGPANDALLLAAGYLSDLYMLLGNEAYADAANPTIAYNTNGEEKTFGDVTTALFAFKGQLPNVLDEELSLLRGRDDFLTPGTRTTPIFNRLVWNYTRGIDSGEAVYALNYNIKDLTGDGVVGAADAAKAFPQGHGDAYGHYLTALTGYYSLLWNPQFSWVPRSEAVLVLGKPVSVDYFDERKFATAAAAWTRTAALTTDLTYRKAYDPAAQQKKTWSHLGDGRANSRTAQKRTWGVDDWAVRGGQGALFHWVTSNSLLPEVDPNPEHEGIQKIDRETVPEIAEVASQSDAIQRAMDTANAWLNPLGLSDGAVPFDISASGVDEGKTHFDQVYERATSALANAVAAFDRAKTATQLLRSQEESLDNQRDAILTQERAFEAQLIDLYGTPYADDIGPGKLYAQGYSGPDLLHYMYVDLPELFKNSGDDDLEEQHFRLVGDTDFAKAMGSIDEWAKKGSSGYDSDGDDIYRIQLLQEEPLDPEIPAGDQGVGEYVSYTLNGNGEFRKPESWTGRRAHPGTIQQAISEVQMARLNLSNALEDYGDFTLNFRRAARNYKAVMEAHSEERKRMVNWAVTAGSIEGVISAIELGFTIYDEIGKVEDLSFKAVDEAIPKVVGLANDAFSAARAAIVSAQATQSGLETTFNIAKEITFTALNTTLTNLERTHERDSFDIAWRAEHLQLVSDLKGTFEELEDGTRTIDMALRAYHDARNNVRTLIAQGDTIQRERELFRKRAAAIIQGYRTKDLGFRAFRNEALESYKSLFDLASRYTYLAARSYDYETGLVDAAKSPTAKAFFQDIVRSRAVGVFADGVPQQASSTVGDPGLSGVLARMNSDWSVAKSRFGFNNPSRYHTTFSLRREARRIIDGEDGDAPWKDYLASCRMANVLDDKDVKANCLNINPDGLLAVPGFVLEFSTTIANGQNFFGKPLAGGDSTFSPSLFATKIRSTGIAFKGYIGMQSPTSIGGSVTDAGALSPNDPGTGFSDPNALSATPYIYVIPVGYDSMRSPSSTGANIVRSWTIEDQAIPLPFDVGGAFSTETGFASGQSSLRESFTLRKHSAFRAVPAGTVFSSANGFTNARLIGRSVWNSKWKIVIPGSTLLALPQNGMAKFLEQVKDIQLHFETYSYSGN